MEIDDYFQFKKRRKGPNKILTINANANFLNDIDTSISVFAPWFVNMNESEKMDFRLELLSKFLNGGYRNDGFN